MQATSSKEPAGSGFRVRWVFYLLVLVTLLLLNFGADDDPALDSPPSSSLGPDEVDAFLALTDDDLARELAVIWPLVAERVGVPDAPQPAARFVTAEQLSILVRDALLAQPEIDDEVHPTETANEQAEKLVDLAAGAYIEGSWELLIARELMLSTAEIYGSARSLQLDVVRVLLAHEAVHAAAERRIEELSEAAGASSEDFEHGFGAAAEGYAQFITLDVARAIDHEDAFRVVAAGLDLNKAPVPAYAMHRSALKVATFASRYVDGLRFVQTIAEALGDDMQARLLREPPADWDLLRHPDRYLSPEITPRARFVLDTGAPLVAPALGDGWEFHESQRSEASLAALLRVLPVEVQREVLEPLVQRASAWYEHRADSKEFLDAWGSEEGLPWYASVVRFGYVDLLEFSDAVSARTFVTAFARASAFEQDLRHEGRRVMSSHQSVQALGDTPGWSRTRVYRLPPSLERCVMLVDGAVVVRLDFQYDPPGMERLQALAQMLLDEVHVRLEDTESH